MTERYDEEMNVLIEKSYAELVPPHGICFFDFIWCLLPHHATNKIQGRVQSRSIVQVNILNKKDTHQLRWEISMKVAWRNCMVWIESVICLESTFTKQRFIVTYYAGQQTIKCSKANNRYDKRVPNALFCISFHGWGQMSLDLVLDRLQESEKLARSGFHLISGSPVWGRLRKEKRCPAEMSAHNLGHRARPQFGSRCPRNFWTSIPAITMHYTPNHHIYIAALVLLSTAGVGIMRCICQSRAAIVSRSRPLYGWFLVIPISCRRCFNHGIVLCGTLKRLALSAHWWRFMR